MNDLYLSDSLDDDGELRGTADFWGGPSDDSWYDRHRLGRECTNCGEPVEDRTAGNLCRSCRNRARMDPRVRQQVKLLVMAARRRRAAELMHAWWEATNPADSSTESFLARGEEKCTR